MGLGNWGRQLCNKPLSSHWGGIGTPLGDSPLIGGDGSPLGDSLLSREGNSSPLKMLPSILGTARVVVPLHLIILNIFIYLLKF